MARILAGVSFLLALMSTSIAANAKTLQEVIELPVEMTDIRGQVVSHRIKVTIIRDDAKASSPFLILNHGRAGHKEQNAVRSVTPFFANARYFVSKGFAVFMPLRVGYGETGGPDVEFSGTCGARNYPPVYEAAAVQTLRVIEYAKALPYIDPASGLVVGQSFGGTAAVTIAAKNVPGVKGAVNFAGGGGGRPDTHPEQPCSQDRMTELFASYGATARIPTLWLYSENDKYWGAAIPRVWHKAFVDRGGTGQFVQLPPYKADGHPIFTGIPAAWKPAFETFLQSCCQAASDVAGSLPTAQAPLSHTPEAFTQVLAAWATKQNIKQAVIVVRRDSRTVHLSGIGGADPAAPVHLASLSKAITGACIATLVRDGKLAFDTPLSKALAKFIKANGRPADRRIERVTIAQLLTHRAGFASADDGEDPATRSVLQSYLASNSSREPPKPAYLSMVLAAGLLRDPGKEYAYSNAGYLALGGVIEEATGQAYEDYCRGAVLQPAGAAGALDPGWRVMSSYGGWRMSGGDYLAFLEQLDPARAALGARTRDWMRDKNGKTYGKASYPVWYGPGVRLRDAGRGIEIWHTGSWRRRLPPDAQGPRSADTSTFAIRVADGTSWFVHSTPLVLAGARTELDQELLRAYQSVKSWK
jgi:CubicO group peptidase (beta-lactamase class C family)/dienelactone hydrolase